MKRVLRPYYCAMYYASWFWFGLVGLLLNVVCAFLLPFPRTPKLQRRVRAVIRRLFDLWCRWLHASGVLRVKWIGFPDQLPHGIVYIANHPSLLDATLLLARMPDAFVVFKPALARNPFIAPAAILAGYVSSGRPVETLREAANKVAAGQSLLIFPEGTRTTPGTVLGAFRPGFALIAHRARTPIQVVLIRSSEGLVPRGRPWWRPPTILPATLELSLDRSWPANPALRPAEMSHEIHHDLVTKLSLPRV